MALLPAPSAAQDFVVPDFSKFMGTWLWRESTGTVANSTPEIKGAARTLTLNPDMTYEFRQRRGTRDSVLCSGRLSIVESSENGADETDYALDFSGWYQPYEHRMSVSFQGPDTLDMLGSPCTACPEHTFIRGRTALFRAEVKRGQAYRRVLWDGLRFELKPLELGWEIAVRDSARSGENLIQITTPAEIASDSRVLEGWNLKGGPAGSSAKGEGSAWPRTRNFKFSRDGVAGLRAARSDSAAARSDSAVAEEDPIEPAGRGVMTLESLRVGTAPPGKREGIESMRFTVAIEEARGR